MKKKALAFFLAVLFMLSSMPAFAFADTYGSANNARNGVARIVIIGDVNYFDAKGKLIAVEQGRAISHGSAFAVGENGKPVSYFVTNRHVISASAEIRTALIGDEVVYYTIVPTAITVAMDDEANLHPADIVTDNAGGADLAIVRLREATNLRQPMYLAPYKTDAKLRNSTAYSVGFPGTVEAFLQEGYTLASGINSITTRKGIVSHEVDAVKSNSPGNKLVIDTPLSAGISGGPLVNEKGAVIGVCRAGVEDDPNMNEAISINEVVKLLRRYEVPFETEPDSSFTWLLVTAGVLIAAVVVLLVTMRKPKAGKNGKSAYRLQGLTGVYAGKRYPIDKDLRIGRDPLHNDLVYPAESKKVSGTHCVILLRNNELFIQDSSSRNGTFLNNQRLDPGVTRKLLVGDTITLAENESFRIDVSSKK